MKVEGNLRSGEEFHFVDRSLSMNAPLIAMTPEAAVCGMSFKDIAHLPDDTAVIACWHGQWKTEGFLTTIGALRAKAEPFTGRKKKPKLTGRHGVRQADGSYVWTETYSE